MKTLFRFVFIAIGAALSFAVIAVVALILFFDANAYKDDLTQLVKQQTGRELVFVGDVALTFYPDLGMKLGAMTFSNPADFGQTPMAKVGEASVSVNLASLFKMAPEIDQFVLRGLEVNLLTLEDGRNNWDDLAGGSTASADAAGSSQQDAPSPQGDSAALKIEGAFAGLMIENARLQYQNQQTGANYQLRDFDLSTGRITPDAPFPMQLLAVVSSEGQVDARIEMSAGFQYIIETGILNIEDLALATSAVGPMIPVEDLQVNINSAALSFNPGAGTLSMNNLGINTRATGDILPLGKISTEIGGNSLALDLNQRSINIEGLQLAVDDTRFTGNLNVIDYAQPAVTFKLASDNLDIDALLGTPPPQPPKEGEPEAEPQAVATGSDEDVQISLPVELMRSLFIDGELTAKNMRVQNLSMQDVQVAIKADRGVLRLQPLALNMYSGVYNGGVAIDVSGEQPVYQVRQNLDAVQVGDLLNDFMLVDQIGGAMSANIDLRTRGDWLSELKKNSNGSMSLNFKDGALKGFNLRHSIEAARAKLEGKQPPQMETLQTDFSALGITGVVQNGVFSSDDLNLQAPLIRVGGEGSADLNTNTVNYLVKAKVVGTVKAQDSGSISDLDGLVIPVLIEGPFSSPDIDVRYNEMVNEQLEAEKAALAAEVEQQKQELQRQIDEEKRKLEEARKRQLDAEREKQRLAAEKAKAEAEARLEKEKKKAEEKLENELQKLFD